MTTRPAKKGKVTGDSGGRTCEKAPVETLFLGYGGWSRRRRVISMGRIPSGGQSKGGCCFGRDDPRTSSTCLGREASRKSKKEPNPGICETSMRSDINESLEALGECLYSSWGGRQQQDGHPPSSEVIDSKGAQSGGPPVIYMCAQEWCAPARSHETAPCRSPLWV